MTQECQHPLCYKGTHPSFQKKWLCPDCEQLVDLDLNKYGVVLAAIHDVVKEDRQDDNQDRRGHE